MWGKKRQKKPPERGNPDISEIIPFVKLEPIALPERLTKTLAESSEDEEEKAKLESVASDFTIQLERAKKQANEILNTHT